MVAETLVTGLISVVAGILILIFPSLLRVIVGGYLILAGLLALVVWLL